KDFRLNMLEIDLAYISGVRLSRNRFEFSYAGKYYHYLVWGSSHRLLVELLGENNIAFAKTKDSEIHGA
ncbi:MAG: hypothetical protein LBI11_07060, partial [Streptococcaceae bacterium]|nr:hypothetical protein [Streptococcaceae bacterium]